MKKEIMSALNDERKQFNHLSSIVKYIGKGLLISIVIGIVLGYMFEAQAGFVLFLIIFLFYLFNGISKLITAGNMHNKKREENVNKILVEGAKKVDKAIKQAIVD